MCAWKVGGMPYPTWEGCWGGSMGCAMGGWGGYEGGMRALGGATGWCSWGGRAGGGMLPRCM